MAAAVGFSKKQSPADVLHREWQLTQTGRTRGGWFDKAQHMAETVLLRDYNTLDMLVMDWYAGHNCQACDARQALIDADESRDQRAPFNQGSSASSTGRLPSRYSGQ